MELSTQWTYYGTCIEFYKKVGKTNSYMMSDMNTTFDW